MPPCYLHLIACGPGCWSPHLQAQHKVGQYEVVQHKMVRHKMGQHKMAQCADLACGFRKDLDESSRFNAQGSMSTRNTRVLNCIGSD